MNDVFSGFNAVMAMCKKCNCTMPMFVYTAFVYYEEHVTIQQIRDILTEIILQNKVPDIVFDYVIAVANSEAIQLTKPKTPPLLVASEGKVGGKDIDDDEYEELTDEDFEDGEEYA